MSDQDEKAKIVSDENWKDQAKKEKEKRIKKNRETDPLRPGNRIRDGVEL